MITTCTELLLVLFSVQCAPGTYSDNGVEPCLPCPAGTYQTENGKTTCLPCPGQQSTHGTGASSLSFCGGVTSLSFVILSFLSMYGCKSPCSLLPVLVGYAKITGGLCWKPSEYCKSSINPPGTYLFQTPLIEWVNKDEPRLIWEGGGRGGLFKLAMMVVLLLPKELECKVENLKNKKLKVLEPRIKNQSDLSTREQTIPHKSKWIFAVVIDKYRVSFIVKNSSHEACGRKASSGASIWFCRNLHHAWNARDRLARQNHQMSMYMPLLHFP